MQSQKASQVFTEVVRELEGGSGFSHECQIGGGFFARRVAGFESRGGRGASRSSSPRHLLGLRQDRQCGSVNGEQWVVIHDGPLSVFDEVFVVGGGEISVAVCAGE